MKLLKKQYTALMRVYGRLFEEGELKETSWYLMNGWIEKNHGRYQTTPEFHIYHLYQKALERKDPNTKVVKGLHGYASGSPAGFIDSIRTTGHRDYSFHQLCIYQGFWTAMKISYSYSISSSEVLKYSKLVKDWTKLFGDGFKMIVEDDTHVHTFFTDMKGSLMYNPDMDFRSWQAELQSKNLNNIKISYKPVFFQNHENVNQCLSLETTKSQELNLFETPGDQEKEE